jgi:hypothetical protein
MKLLTLIIFIICAQLNLSGQTDHGAFYDSSSYNYSKTDFSNVDSFNCWSYVLLLESPSHKDSLKSVGELTFQRTHEIGGLTPKISFQVLDIKDSAYCLKKSIQILTASSCLSPDVGGDIIVFGKFIFLNLNVCLRCKGHDNDVDYCRPVINKMFLHVDKAKANSLEQIVGQFPMQGQVLKSPF